MDSRTGERGGMLDVVRWLGSAIAAGDSSPTKSRSSPSETRLGLAADNVSEQNVRLGPKYIRTYLDYWFWRILSG